MQMCGIIGRVSVSEDCTRTLESLKLLEYRGYDSFGVLLYNKDRGEYVLERDVGEIDKKRFDSLKNLKSHIEIGHTRWATHGRVSKENAHPHFDFNRDFFVVMNGIVENFSEVKKKLVDKGYEFSSQTDTEVVVQLFSYYFVFGEDMEKSLLDALRKVIYDLEGEFSFLIKYRDYVLGYKNVNPLIVGRCEGEVVVSSDLRVVESGCDFYHVLDDCESFLCYNDENEVNLKFFDKNFKLYEKESMKSNYVHEEDFKDTNYFMEKEIFEQKDINRLYTKENFDNLRYLYGCLGSRRVVLTGAGTSYHAALYMKYVLLEMGIYSDVVLACELQNYVKCMEGCQVVLFSQSGETADLIQPLRKIKDCEIFSITNTKNSTLDRMASKSCYLNCGREIGVASTKAFVFQMFVAKILQSFYYDYDIERKSEVFRKSFDSFVSKNRGIVKDLCDLFYGVSSIFYLGRGIYYPIALEGALKLKELSYIHAEGFAGGELKHGSLALIEDNVPVVALGSSSEIISNAMEVKTRGGVVIGISKNYSEVYDYFLEVPEYFEDVFATILMQVLAFEMAVALGYNPDKPRNLAKSVTVK